MMHTRGNTRMMPIGLADDAHTGQRHAYRSSSTCCHTRIPSPTRRHPHAVIHTPSCMHACMPCRHTCTCEHRYVHIPSHNALSHFQNPYSGWWKMPCHAVAHACMSSHKYISEMYVLFKDVRVLELQGGLRSPSQDRAHASSIRTCPR